MKKVFLLMPVLVSLLVVTACAPATQKMELAEGAVQLSPVIPGHGGHWSNPAQLPLGPIYLVDGKGEVIGIEYMYTEDMMHEVSLPTPEGPEVFKDLGNLPVGVIVDHVTVSFMPHGHEAFEVPHTDVHLWFITADEKAAVTPGG